MNNKSFINELRVASAKRRKRKYIKSGCILLYLQWYSQISCVLYINTKKTQQRRRGMAKQAGAINLYAENSSNGFLVFKPEFSRRLSRVFSRPASRLSTNRSRRQAKSAA